MKNTISFTALTGLVLTFITPPAKAQSGGVYDVRWTAIDGGGGTSAGGNYSVSGTAGQPDAGTLTGGIYSVSGGFWGSVPPVSGYAAWVAGFGLTGPAAADNADPDKDAISNGEEYILGGNPAVPGTSGSPAATSSGGDIILTFSRADASETPDVTLTVESGSDLLTWPTVFFVGSTTAASSPGVTVTENGASHDTITVIIPRGTAPRRFARMRVIIAL